MLNSGGKNVGCQSLRSRLCVSATDESGGVPRVADLFNERLIQSYDPKWEFLPFTAAGLNQEFNASKIGGECGQIEIYGKSRKLSCYDMVLSYSRKAHRSSGWV